jgi:hypothetical protein
MAKFTHNLNTALNKSLEPNSGPAFGFSAAPISRRRFLRLWLSSYPLGVIEHDENIAVVRHLR